MTSPTWWALAWKAKELLSDGQWHDYDAIAKDLMPMIPPGQAWRRAEMDRGYWHNKTNGTGGPVPPRRRPVPPELVVTFGQRSIVRDFLRTKAFEKQRVAVPGGTKKRALIRMVSTPKRAEDQNQRTARALASVRPNTNPLGPWTVHNAEQQQANRLLYQIITGALTAMSDETVAHLVGCNPRTVHSLANAARRMVSGVLTELDVGSEVYLQRSADGDDDGDTKEELTHE